MSDSERPVLAFSDLMAAVGEVLLRWGHLEVEILKKVTASGYAFAPRVPPIQQLRLASTRTLADIAEWIEEIDRAAQIRNLLAHGLIAGSSQPAEGDPAVVCRDMDGQHHTISYDALIEAAQTLDLLRLRLHREPDDLLRAEGLDG